MKRYGLKLGFLLLCLVTAGSVHAANSLVSGTFTGVESKLAALPGACVNAGDLPYREVGTFTVSVTDMYMTVDSFNWVDGTFTSGAIDIVVHIYEGSFDPANPGMNRVTFDGVDVWEEVTLNAGITYVLVIQVWCEDRDQTGTWAVAFTGDGEVTADLKREIPDFTFGSFSEETPTGNVACSDGPYITQDIQVSRTGRYFYTDIGWYSDEDICVGVHEGTFDPDNPFATQIDGFDDGGWITLEEGMTYTLVIQAWSSDADGDFWFQFAPPATFRTTSAISGSWYYPVTDGQGLFFDYFDASGLLFVAWFTFDLERPGEGVEAQIGDPGHRWVTGLGTVTDNVAMLDLYWTGGMIFDSADPPKNTEQDGTMKVTLTSCGEGNIEYDLGTANRTGMFPITRLSAIDNQAACEDSYEGAGIPGPL